MLSSTTLFAILSALALTSVQSAPADKDALDYLANKAGKRYLGTAIQSYQLVNNPQYVQILESQFDAITPENEMKWEVVEPTEGNFDFSGTDKIVAEAKKTGSIVRGHNICWDSQTPAWVTSITDPKRLKEVLKNHIDAVIGRYKDDLAYFDIVNEPLNENGTYKSNVWYNVLGESYIETALRYAHEVAPNMKLCINDYNIETVNAKSKAMAVLSAKLLAKNAPLHCIGFESHFIGGSTPKDIPASMRQFSDLGLEVPMTELDVRIPVTANDQPANATVAKAQVDDYYTSISACLGNDMCPGVSIWQFADPTSWIPGVFKGYGAALLYDAEYQPKSTYYVVQQALRDGKKTATRFKGCKVRSRG
ncbi:Endo-1,4-beta-xylanase [Naganishia friedmannii]|uniref:Endo-1,4-beta-xylanase n=1 Tax=Naganishia friedmannii TaxID=89922 RepID=A0ACC2VAD8_9TREE|nr:Endo-1,4-beta-xylanase [Naganishia friedmannii]